MKRKGTLSVILGLICSFCISCQKTPPVAAPSPAQSEPPKIQIGMLFDTFVLERWLKDRDVFVATATSLGAEVNVQNANGVIEEQIKQMEYLIEKKVDVIVIIATDTNSQELRDLVADAKMKGIKVIAYDRLIEKANVDFYISFNNPRVGELMAEAVLERVPATAKIAAIYGAPTDYNVPQVKSGVYKVLERHGAKLIYEAWADNWKAEYAFEYTNECIDRMGLVDAIICGNDALAAQAFKALSERRLADKVILVGQDADIDACQRIVGGNQYMTVYKSINALAKQAAGYAVSLAQGKTLNTKQRISDGSYDIPYCYLEPIAVTKENMDSIIIDSQFHFKDDVYLYAE